ncbi:MAG: tetratricopeptide (TPR) repeat protein [Flavobacteriales bacterium]|jgi:tetratricopeptide (TPR) repeat protein|tara:strand:+ start:2517 stop:3809 length:1293 start_codon:yes stop_codon:yes gene_type:complete
MKNIKKFISLVIIIIFTNSAFANTWNWGTNEIKSKGVWLKMEKLIKQKKYIEATPLAQWLLTNNPDLNVALYINAIKIYEKKVSAEKSEEVKAILQDSALFLYDKRVEVFGNEKKVLNRKGRVAWKYLSDRPNTNSGLFELYSKIYELNQMETKPINLYNWMQAGCKEFQGNKLAKKELVSIFSKSNPVFDHHLTTSKKPERVKKYKTLTVLEFGKKSDLDCSLINEEFGRKFNANKSVDQANLIVSLCVFQKCFTDSSFIIAADYLAKEGKSNYSLEKTLAQTYLSFNDTKNADSTFKRVLNLTDDSLKKAAVHFELAKIEVKKRSFSEAIRLANTALLLNPSLLKAHEFIGDLYVTNIESCNSGNIVEKRCVYIAAYNEYRKANVNAKANEMKLQFPSVEELFLYNLKAGDNFKTQCWVNKEVVLLTR